MTSLKWTRLPVLVTLVRIALVLTLSRAVAAGRSDRTMSLEEYVAATVNATVLDAKGHAVHMMSSEDGKYGQNSPKIDIRGIVIPPAPHNGGKSDVAHCYTTHLRSRGQTHLRSVTPDLTSSEVKHTQTRQTHVRRRGHTHLKEINLVLITPDYLLENIN